MVAASYAAFTFVRQIRSLIVWLISALFLSFALEPAVNWLGRHGWKRGLATFAVLLGLGVLVVVMIASMVPLVLAQVQGLIEKVPGWLDHLSVYTKRWFNVDISSGGVLNQVKNLGSDVKGIVLQVRFWSCSRIPPPWRWPPAATMRPAVGAVQSMVRT